MRALIKIYQAILHIRSRRSPGACASFLNNAGLSATFDLRVCSNYVCYKASGRGISASLFHKIFSKPN